MIDAELYDRRAPEGRLGGKRELPVLFHLRDASRPRVVRPTAEESLPLATADTPAPSAAESGTPAFTAAFEPATTSPPAMYALAPALPQLNVVQEVLEQPSSSPPAAPAAEKAPAITPLAEAASASDVPSSTEVGAADVRPARRFKTPPTEEWFATHGRYIAAGFVLALIGTVYLARTTRKATPPASATTQSAPLLAESETSVATDSAVTIALPPASSSSAVAVAKPVAPEAPKVELQLPVASQVDRSPAAAAEQSASGDSLFVFQPTKRAEERVAVRDAPVPASANLPAPPLTSPAENSSANASLPAAYPVTSSPVSYQESSSAPASYPRTSAPTLSPPMPVASPPMPTVPVGTPFPSNAPLTQGAYVPPGGMSPSSWQPPVAAPPLPGTYQSPETIARGPRYERTGSGNY